MVERGDRRGRPDGLRAEQHLSGAAAAQGHGRKAGRAEGHALFRGDRQYRGGQLGQSGRARAGLPHRGEVHRRHAGEEGPAPLHHRAGALSAQAAAGASGRGRRAGHRRSRPRPTSNASRNWCSARPPRRRRSMPRTAKRDSDKAKVLQAQADTKQAQINLDYTRVVGAVRRHRDGAPGLGRRAGRRQRHAGARHHRAARSDLREFQCQRARRAARARHALQARPEGVGSARHRYRGRLADRCGLSAQGQARLHRADGEPGHRHARGARRAAERAAADAAGLLRTRARAARGSRRAAGALRRARERSGRPLRAGRERRERRGAAQGRDRPGGRRDDRDRERAEAGRPRDHRRAVARDTGTEGRSADRRPPRSSRS